MAAYHTIGVSVVAAYNKTFHREGLFLPGFLRTSCAVFSYDPFSEEFSISPWAFTHLVKPLIGPLLITFPQGKIVLIHCLLNIPETWRPKSLN